YLATLYLCPLAVNESIWILNDFDDVFITSHGPKPRSISLVIPVQRMLFPQLREYFMFPAFNERGQIHKVYLLLINCHCVHSIETCGKPLPKSKTGVRISPARGLVKVGQAASVFG